MLYLKLCLGTTTLNRISDKFEIMVRQIYNPTSKTLFFFRLCKINLDTQISCCLIITHFSQIDNCSKGVNFPSTLCTDSFCANPFFVMFV